MIKIIIYLLKITLIIINNILYSYIMSKKNNKLSIIILIKYLNIFSCNYLIIIFKLFNLSYSFNI